jgi:hypothetical protein
MMLYIPSDLHLGTSPPFFLDCLKKAVKPTRQPRNDLGDRDASASVWSRVGYTWDESQDSSRRVDAEMLVKIVTI